MKAVFNEYFINIRQSFGHVALWEKTYDIFSNLAEINGL